MVTGLKHHCKIYNATTINLSFCTGSRWFRTATKSATFLSTASPIYNVPRLSQRQCVNERKARQHFTLGDRKKYHVQHYQNESDGKSDGINGKMRQHKDVRMTPSSTEKSQTSLRSFINDTYLSNVHVLAPPATMTCILGRGICEHSFVYAALGRCSLAIIQTR